MMCQSECSQKKCSQRVLKAGCSSLQEPSMQIKEPVLYWFDVHGPNVQEMHVPDSLQNGYIKWLNADSLVASNCK